MSNMLGPFVGYVSSSTATIWLQYNAQPAGSLLVTLHDGSPSAASTMTARLQYSAATLNTGIASFENLAPDHIYYYKIWLDSAMQVPPDLGGLTTDDLRFRTLPTDDAVDRLDFLLLSCHNPVCSANADGCAGFGVWKQIPELLTNNGTIRFAILGGDQVYSDAVAGRESALLNEPDPAKRQSVYLDTYRQHWDNLAYRKVLCSLPSVLMWDDHDITDGWGSRQDSYAPGTNDFLSNWLGMFATARNTFQFMQASRNPTPLSAGYRDGFDTAFQVGRTAFVLIDLRSNRNVKNHQMWKPEQLANVRNWVAARRGQIDTLFLLSTVVFSHDPNVIDDIIDSSWADVMGIVEHFAKNKWLKNAVAKFNRDVGDLRDDVDDSWGSRANALEADRILDFLFGLQNPTDGASPINVIILSGDIHTPGYSTIYSSDPQHAQRATIPHIVSSPVAYEASSWILEAIFRDMAVTVQLGARGVYTAQVSHHFCRRTAVVLSLRPVDNGQTQLLKVKYYLEGYPEPQILLFDLTRSSHREHLTWSAPT